MQIDLDEREWRTVIDFIGDQTIKKGLEVYGKIYQQMQMQQMQAQQMQAHPEKSDGASNRSDHFVNSPPVRGDSRPKAGTDATGR